MIKIRTSGDFDKDYRDLIKESPEIKKEAARKLILFSNNPLDTRLRSHKLSGRLRDKWAFSITYDVRIIYEWRGKANVRFLAIGKHDKVYKKVNDIISVCFGQGDVFI